MTADGCGIADVNLPQHSIKWREKSGLSPREREIMIQVALGRLSKQIANDIGISEPTVKVHRSNAMRKLDAHSLPEFGRMAVELGLVSEKSQSS